MLKNKKQLPVVLLLTGLVLLLAVGSVTTDSLWVDEVCRVSAPVRGDLKETIRFSLECGQPGYMLWMMLWSHLPFVDTTEAALRLNNLVFVCAALFYVFRIVRKKQWPLWTTFLFFFHPMFVYYMDETTPYILIYALSLALIWHTYSAEDFSSTRNIVCLNIIMLLGMGIHFLFAFATLLYFTQCFLKIRKDRKAILRHAGIMACFSVGYIPLLYLYATHLNGTATGLGLKNILYVIYAFLGMAGMGLSRNDLRAGNFEKLTVVNGILLGIFVAALLLGFAAAIRVKTKSLRKNRDMLIGSGVYLGMMIIVALFADFGMWERHCMAIFPIYEMVLIELFLEIVRNRSGRAILALYLLLLGISSARIRLDSVYTSEDIRGVRDAVSAAYQQTEDLTVIADCDFGYYSLKGSRVNEEQEFISSRKMPEKQILAIFEEEMQQGNVMLVLSERYASRKVYYQYDADPGFSVDASVRGFRIITPVRNECN